MATIACIERTSGTRFKAIVKRKGIILATKTFRDEGQARHWANEVERDKERLESWEAHGSITVGAAIKSYMAQYDGRDHSLRKRLELWDNWIGTTKLDDVTPVLIRTMLDKYEDTRGVNGSTLNRIKASLSAIFTHAMGEGLVISNPARRVKSRKQGQHVIRWLSEDERTRLMSSCKQSTWPKLYLLVLMALTTGARKGDLMGLKWADIDMNERIAHVARTKNGTSRVLSLSLPVIEELKYFQNEAEATSLLFHSTYDRQRPRAFTKEWYAARERAGVEEFRFHDLRHTTASYLAQSGIPLNTIAEILGHSSLQTTMRYAHLNHAARQQVQDKVLGSII